MSQSCSVVAALAEQLNCGREEGWLPVSSASTTVEGAIPHRAEAPIIQESARTSTRSLVNAARCCASSASFVLDVLSPSRLKRCHKTIVMTYDLMSVMC